MDAWVLIILLAAFLFTWFAWLVFTLIFPRQWARMVDRENDFFLKRGLVSESVSRGFKQLEKGIVLRLALAGAILVAMMDLTVVVLRYVLGFRI